MTILDNIPDSAWFFCFPMSIAVWCIIALGVFHPCCWLKVWRVYRSELFMFMYALVGVWCLLSCALIYGVIAESSCIYVFWIWYTMVFCLAMAGLMFLLFCGFCVLGMKRKSVGALLALIYYLVSLYFVMVVNKQRKEVFGLKASCGSCFVETIERKAFELAPGFVANKHGAGETTIYYPLNRTNIPTTPSPTATNVIVSSFPPVSLVSLPPVRTEPPSPVLTRTTTAPQLMDEDDTVKLALQSLASFLSTHGSVTHTPAPTQLTRTWAGALFRREVVLNLTTPSTLSTPSRTPPTTLSGPLDYLPDRGLSAIARLSNLLINSDECRTPRHPPHGRYAVAGDSRALRVSLRCEPGYAADSDVTECKHNWWDRPLPQCSKLAPPQTGSTCILPPVPPHGRYTVLGREGPPAPAPLPAGVIVLAVSCDAPYRPVDPLVVCVRGHWRHAPPDCQKHCKLDPHPSVEYKCLSAFQHTVGPCPPWAAGGSAAEPACRPAHAHRGPFRYMRCRDGAWDHVLTCVPNANFTLR